MAAVSNVGEARNERRMSFFEHLEELRRRLKVVVVVVVVFFLFFITFSIQPIHIGSGPVMLPVPSFAFQDQYGNDPIANQIFRSLVAYVKPSWVNLTAKAPWDGVVVQLEMAFFLALLAASPVTSYEFAKFIGPALRPSEKRLIIRVAAPVLVLFLAGVLLSLVVVLPFTFNLLYSVQQGLGVQLYLLFIDDFVSFVLLFLVAFGLAFELPVIMYGVTAVGMVTPDFWKKNWRFAAVAIFVFGAFITPDGSGVTMIFVAAPMLALYAIGYLATRRRERLKSKAKSS